MLYHFHELQRAFLKPASSWAESAAQLYRNPYSPLSYSPVSKRIAAALDLAHRLGKDYEKPEWQIEGVTATPVWSHPFCNLLRFDSEQPSRAKQPKPKLLVVAPLSGHHATLLRDTVRTLLEDHEVFITDWVDARMVPLTDGPFGLDDYVALIESVIRHLGPGLHIVSVCQPTVPVLAAVSLMASRGEPSLPRSMIMMGGPIDARSSPTAVNDLAEEHSLSWFERNVIHTVPQRYPGYLRKVYPGFLQYAGFVSMNPSRHANSHWDYFKHLIKGDDDATDAHKAFYNEYNAVLDLSAEFYLDTIRVVFQEHLLPNGDWHVKGEHVRPQDIRQTALLTIEGALDDISGLGQTKAAHALCKNIAPSHRQHLEVPGAGHFGIFSGRRWRTLVAPTIRDFVASHACH